MKQTRIATYIDLLFCLVILPMIIMLVPIDRWFVHHTTFVVTLIVFLYLLYLLYRKVNLPALFMQRRYGRILLLMAGLTLLTWLLAHYPFPPDERLNPHELSMRAHLRSQAVWFFFLVVTGFGLAIELTFELFRQTLSKQEIEAEKNRAELALYKAQINPHFLFNTLNALYGLVLTKSDKAESAFIKFTEMLKYLYEHATNDTVDVSDEIAYIRQYIDLQSLRLNHHTQVHFESSTDHPQEQIPPMVLITFVENAFKYGSSPEEDCEIRIRITVRDGELRFTSENSVMRELPAGETAVGIANCRKRLELLYPGRFTLTTGRTGREFRVHLNLRLR